MSAIAEYFPDFVIHHNQMFDTLWNVTPWERRELSGQRRECWMSDGQVPYSYEGRMYVGSNWHTITRFLRDIIGTARIRRRNILNTKEFEHFHFQACLIEGYESHQDHHPWRSYNTEIVDHTKPTAILSLGTRREFFIRDRRTKTVESQILEPGSLLFMHAGSQVTHEYRVPKHPAECLGRVSLTFCYLVKDSIRSGK
jgi:alkylated DNA repair dioxygenase AlkB